MSFFCSCFSTGQESDGSRRLASKKGSSKGRASGSGATYGRLNWQSVPPDVLQLLSVYLSQSEVAAIKLVCRHWRNTINSWQSSLCLPLAALASWPSSARPSSNSSTSSAASTLLRLAGSWKSLRTLVLVVHDGWEDPIQARIDLQPIVTTTTRSLGLGILTGWTGLRELQLKDATFTRRPWSLAELTPLTHLAGLSLEYESAAWPPDQVALEYRCLNGVSMLTQLQSLQLRKLSYSFLREPCYQDANMVPLSTLTQLQALEVGFVKLTSGGVLKLNPLVGLTSLVLIGHIEMSVQVLVAMVHSMPRLQRLHLARLLMLGGSRASNNSQVDSELAALGSGPVSDSTSSSSNGSVMEVLRFCRSLTHVKLMCDSALRQLTFPLTTIQEFSLSMQVKRRRQLDALQYVTNCLTSLSLYAVDLTPAISEMLGRLTSLKRLTLAGSLHEPPEALLRSGVGCTHQLEYLAALTRLRHFTLHLDPASTPLWHPRFSCWEAVLRHMAASWPALTYLHMDFNIAPRGHSSEILDIFDAFASLTHLSLASNFAPQPDRPAYCPVVLDCRALPEDLMELSLVGMKFGTDDAAALSVSCPYLSALRLVETGGFNTELAGSIGGLLPNLNVLVVREPRRNALTSEHVAALVASGVHLLGALALSLNHTADVAPLARLRLLRHLVLDSNSKRVVGLRALTALPRLRSLMVPLPYVDVEHRNAINAVLCSATGCVVTNTTKCFGKYRGVEWLMKFSLYSGLWSKPEAGQCWRPMLHVHI